MAYDPAFADRVAEEAQRRAEELMRRFMAEQRDKLKDDIRRQTPESFADKPLSPTTVAKKATLGLDPRTMISTGHYVDSIKVIEERSEDGKTLFLVGFDETDVALDERTGKPRPGSPLTMVAKVQEFGSASAGVPARPHWRPATERMEREAIPVLTAIERLVRDAIDRIIKGR